MWRSKFAKQYGAGLVSPGTFPNPLPSGFCAPCVLVALSHHSQESQKGWRHLSTRNEECPGSYNTVIIPWGSSNQRGHAAMEIQCPSLRLKTKTSLLYKCFVFLLRKYCISILSNPATITQWQNLGPVSAPLVLIRGVSLPLFSPWNIFSL